MGVDVLIEGVSYLGQAPETYTVDLESVEIDLDIAVQQSRATFDVWIYNSFTSGSYQYTIPRPKAGQEVVFLNAAGDREFGGILMDVEEEEREPNIMVYHCECSDFTKWFDRHLVNQQWLQNTTVQTIINDIVSQYVNTPGNTRTFTTHNVQQFPQVPMPITQFFYVPPSQCMAQLSQLLGWGWYIDSYRDVHFYQITSNPSPLPNNELNADDLWTDPNLSASELPNWVDLKISENVSQLKNFVFITGIYVAQSKLYTETMVGDGQTTVFSLGYQPPADASQITVSVNGTPQQIALEWVDGSPGQSGPANTVYVDFSAQRIRFSSPPPNGATITVTYYPMQQTVYGQPDPQSQAFMAARDGTDGIYQYNRMDPSLSAETVALAQQRAQMILYKYAYPYISGTFRSYLPGWQVGQNFTFYSNRRFNGELNGRTFYVTRVSKRIVKVHPNSDWLWEYTITFANIPFEI